jgi:Family of unknown function (DUF6104)
MYFTDRGIEELADRRGEEQVSVAWLAERLRDFVDLNPDFETAVDRLATWLARLDDDEDLLYRTERPVSAPDYPPAMDPDGCGIDAVAVQDLGRLRGFWARTRHTSEHGRDMS